MYFSISLIFFVSFGFDSFASTDFTKKDYCTLLCGVHKHTLCEYQPEIEANGCTAIQNIITDEGRSAILSLHNSYRDKLAEGQIEGWPSAANMMLMTYDRELEESALRWAMQCKPGHDKCRRTFEINEVNQNFGTKSHSGYFPTPSCIFEEWISVDQSISFDDQLPCSLIQPFVTLANIAWASSYKVGCGAVTYIRGGRYFVTLVCNYAPAGDALKYPMYQGGEACSQCPKGSMCFKNSTFPYLCTYIDYPMSVNEVFLRIASTKGVTTTSIASRLTYFLLISQLSVILFCVQLIT